MKTFDVRQLGPAGAEPRWIVVVSTNGGPFGMAPMTRPFASQEEAEAGALHMRAVENG